MKRLSQRDDIVITNADKGGVAVIIHTVNYIAVFERQLNDTNSSKRLENDPTQKNSKLVNDTIGRFKNDKFNTNNIAQKLITTNPRMSKLYTTPKIHKGRNPGQFRRLSYIQYVPSQYVEYHLQPIIKQISSYVKDTNDFINKVKD